jgi:hypothetical protein
MKRLALALFYALASTSFADEKPDFWKHWGDGKAELDGYALIQPRYGQPRHGTAVLIYVTEDFSDSLRVKADPGKHPASDVYPVLKLNFVRDFQTGIYDYNLLTSTFVKADDLSLVKSSFSAQEWCGHTYEQWLPRGGQLVGASHSYFDGEADQSPSLPLPPGGVVEEQLPILVRELRGEWLKAGETLTLSYLPSSLRARFAHVPRKWTSARVSRSRAGAQSFVYTVEADGVTTRFTVENAWPHRLLAWEGSDGESGKLLGSTRQPYWEEHGNGDEKYLKLLGLRK